MPDNPEIWKAAAMADQFDKMQKLPDPLPGCPNFQDPRLQGLHLRPAHPRWHQERPREGDRHDLPQGWPNHLAELEAGARCLCQRPANLREASKQDWRICRAWSCHP